MASRGLGTLTLDLIAKIGGFEQGMDKAARHADKRMREIEARANKFGKVLGTAIATGAAAAVAGLIAVTKNAIDSADRLNDISKRLGVSTEALSAWGYAAQQSGTDLEALNLGLTRFTKNVASAADAGSRQGEIFAALGVSVKDAAGNLRSVEDLLPEIATAFKDMDNATLESALSMELFGKSGAQLLQFLNEGGDGLKAFEERARELGIVISQDTAEAADEFKDQLADLKAMVSGVGLNIAADLLPPLIQLIKDFREAAKEGGAVDIAISGLGVAFETVAGLASVLSNTLQGVIADLKAVASTGAAAWAVLTGNFAGAAGHLEEAAANRARAAEASRNISGTLFGREMRTTPVPNLQVPFLQPLFPQFSAVPLQTAQGGSSSKEAALNALLAGSSGGAKKGGGGRAKKDTSLEDAARDAAKAKEELDRLVKQTVDAKDAFDAMAASLAGPLADANFQFIKDQERLNELAREGEVGATDLAIAQDNLRVAHEKNIKVIQEQLTPAEEVLAGLREEIELLGMNDIAQQKLIATRQAGSEATAEQVAEIERLIELRHQAAQAADLQREVEAGLADAMYDVISGTKSAGDALKDFFDDLAKYILRMITENWAKQIAGLFSGGASSGQGGTGTNWFSLIAGMFGGGKASGGTVQAGTMYRVNENGTEMLSIGGKDYLMMGSQPGRITPNHQLSTPGGNSYGPTNIYVQGAPDRRTISQIDRANGRRARREMARSGA